MGLVPHSVSGKKYCASEDTKSFMIVVLRELINFL